MKKLLLFALCLAPIALFAQSPVIGGNGVLYVSAAPSGTCNAWSLAEFVVPAGSLYTCQSGTWAQVSGSGGGVSTASLPLAITGANIAISQANGSTNGYLGSTDWSTFNGKFNGASCTNDGSGNVTCTSFTTPQLTTPDSQLLRPGSGVTNPSFYRGWTGPTNPATEAYSIIMPDAVPTAGQVIVAGVPSGSPAVSQGTWAPIPAAQVAANLAASTSTGVTGILPVANGGTGQATLTPTLTIASGALALATSSISTGACQTVAQGSVNSAAATGAATTDTIQFTPNGSIKAITGYVPATTGGLTIAAYPTAGYVNFDVCNWTSGAIVPGALTINWKVTR